MNREERRRAARSEGRASFEETRSRAEKKAQGHRVLRGYFRDGKFAFEQHIPTDMDHMIPHQIRVVEVPLSYQGPPIRSVPDAEREGRIEWIRCFLYDEPTRSYREAIGGYDRYPEIHDATEHIHNFTRADDHALARRMDEIVQLLPQGSIFPYEALMLAYFEREVREGDNLLDPAVAERLSAGLFEMLERTGYMVDQGVGRISEGLTRLPRLRVMLIEAMQR